MLNRLLSADSPYKVVYTILPGYRLLNGETGVGIAVRITYTIFKLLTSKAFVIKGVCTCIFGAGGSVSVYLFTAL